MARPERPAEITTRTQRSITKLQYVNDLFMILHDGKPFVSCRESLYTDHKKYKLNVFVSESLTNVMLKKLEKEFNSNKFSVVKIWN